jgi:hypothetical protein
VKNLSVHLGIVAGLGKVRQRSAVMGQSKKHTERLRGITPSANQDRAGFGKSSHKTPAIPHFVRGVFEAFPKNLQQLFKLFGIHSLSLPLGTGSAMGRWTQYGGNA